MNPDIKINQATHTKILKTFFRIVVHKIIHEMFRFPFSSMGHIYLIKNKVTIGTDETGNLKIKASTNWPETRKLRDKTGDKTKRVVYLNEHTNGYIYKVYWNKGKRGFINREFYHLIIDRNFSQSIKEAINSSIKPLNAYAK